MTRRAAVVAVETNNPTWMMDAVGVPEGATETVNISPLLTVMEPVPLQTPAEAPVRVQVSAVSANPLPVSWRSVRR